MTDPERKPDHVGGSPSLTDSRSRLVIPSPPPFFFLVPLRASIFVSDNWSGNYAVINRDGSRASYLLLRESLCLLSPSLFSLSSCSLHSLLRPPTERDPSFSPPDPWLKKIKDNPVREHVDLSLSSFSATFPLLFSAFSVFRSDSLYDLSFSHRFLLFLIIYNTCTHLHYM